MSGELDDARRGFTEAERAADGNKVSALARVGLGRVELREGRALAAGAIFAGIRRQYTPRPEAHEAVACALVGHGDALRLLGQPDESARSYREATGEAFKGYRRQYLAALCGLGELAMETRDTSRMGIVFRSLEAEPDAGFFGAIARAMAGRMSEFELSDAATFESRDMAARAHYCLGLRKDLAGDSAGARRSYARAIELSGGISWYRFFAGGRTD